MHLGALHFSFPVDLVGAVRDRWDAFPARQVFALPDDATLQLLLETCYHASMRTAEQHPVSCILAYIPVEGITEEAVLRFQIPLKLTDSELARLSPVTKHRQTLIGCDYVGRRLRIWGLFEYGRAWARMAAGDPPDVPVDEADLPPDCLTIHIESPGALSVSRGLRTLVRLREGQVWLPQRNPLRGTDNPLGAFFHELLDRLRHGPHVYRRVLHAQPQTHSPSLLEVYTRAVTAILERIRLRRHGGSIVITQQPLDETLAHITYTIVPRMGLSDEIVNYHEAIHVLPDPVRADETARLRAEATLRLASQRLVRELNEISLLAGVDGAVLLDDYLRVQGFGVRFPVLLPTGTTITNAVTGLEYACDEWGLRHQSVFSLCQKCERAVGLIVSQDGGVKAVKAIKGRLHFWDTILD